MNRVLVIAPHPDDEVIGCGGSIAKLAQSGAEVTVVIVIRRERGSRDHAVTDEEFATETADACRVLGVKRYITLEEPSRDFAVDRRLHLAVVRLLREVRPDRVYVPHRDDGDAEHQAVHRLALEALWMAQSDFFEEAGPPAPPPSLVLGYEIWAPLAQAQYTEDVTAQIDLKVEAMQCYRSQLRHAAWDEAVRGLASYRAVTSTGRGHSEAFEVIRVSGSPV
ncbi:PIG-L deacetylase family protein [Streptomyces maremycinicus]|uniref:PIG-L deacetylase family protein n=1 Tax=Streptomyces maremycinicus TaxID=1679753 RepID=UPI000788433F|nr:PIG-L deacetylase family protein [Streptomyces sp. NBRC 110468]